MAFTRNPSDTGVSPATYTADGGSDLVLLDQQRDIAIDGSDNNDVINVTAGALASNALYNYDVRGFAGNDTIDFRAALIQDSTINGNLGNDTMFVGFGTVLGGPTGTTSLNNSLFLGGKDNDTIRAFGVSDGEVNGNLGNDTILVDNLGVNAGFNLYVGGGQGNDVVSVIGDYTNSIIDGNKGVDTIDVFAGNHSNSSINGGEGDDILRSSGATTQGLKMNGDLGNDTIVSVGNFGSTVTGGEGNDTIVTFSVAGQNSTVDAGVGGDTVVAASGGVASTAIESYVFNAGDSVAATTTSFAGAAGVGNSLTAGDTITFGNKVDFLQSFGTTDKIDIDFTPAAVVDVTNANLTTTLAAGTIYEVYGAFNATTNVFTTGTAGGGADSIYIVGGGNLTLGQVFTNSTNMFVTDEDLALGSFV